MVAKKSKHPLAVSMREAQQCIADTLAASVVADVNQAMRVVREVTDRGDVNGTRLQAARTILELAGVLGGKRTSVTATAQTGEREKMVIQVVHVEKPPAEED